MKTGFQSKIAVAVMFALFLCSIPASCLASELTLRAYRGNWSTQERPGYWLVNLEFNHPVFADDLKNAIKVTLDSADERFELLDSQEHREASGAAKKFRLVPAIPSRLAASVKVVVARSLSDASGRYLMARKFSFQFLYGKTITVSSFSTFFRSRTDKGLNLRLSAAVEQNELTAAIKITPSVPNLTVTRMGQLKYQITGDFAYDQQYSLQISEVLVDNGLALLEERKFDFQGPGIKHELAVRTERSVVELKGRQLLPLTLADVTKVRCELARIPPYLVPQILSYKKLEKVRHPEPEPADEEDSDSRDGVVAESPAPPASPAREEALWRGIGSIQAGGRKEAIEALAKTGRVFAGFLGEFTQASEAFFASEARDHTLGYSLPLSFRASPDKGGLWVASLSDPDGNFKGETSRLIQITDLSISYKLSANNLLLWVTSLHTGQPVPGVELLLDRDDGVRSFVGKTDKGGVLFLRDGDKFPSVQVGRESWGITNQPLSVSQVRCAVAATNGDACAVLLNDVRLKPSGITQTKDVQDVPDARTGYLFTERGVYKPGETVQFKFFARAYKDDQIVSPAGEKPKLEIVGPRQDVVYSKELTLSEFGTCHDSLKVESFFPVGTYTLKATLERNERNGKKRDVFTRTFLVQEYKRPKHFVSLSMKSAERVSKEYIGLDKREDSLSVEVTGQYYTGGPVKHTKARWNATLVPVTNRVPGLEGYFFGNEDEKTLFLESGESMLDASGKLNISIPLDSRLVTGIYGVSVSATVLDIDGEPATEVGTFNPKPRFLVGISQRPGQAGNASPMKIIVSDAKGKLVQQGKIEACIMERKSFYTRKRDEAGNINSLWEVGWAKKRTSQQKLVKGEAILNMDFSGYGDYLVVFTYEDNTGRYTSQKLFRGGFDDYDNWTHRQAGKDTGTSNQIMVAMSKKEYVPGESVRIDFHTPRPIKQCLVTMERNGILDFRLIDVNGTDGRYEFKAEEKYQPNVYVSVIGSAGREGYPVYASQTDTDIPTIFFGYANATVRNQVNKLRVEIDSGQAELKGRPGEGKKLSLKVMDQSGKGVLSELAVCVVDEAMLALTRFKTPELSALTNFDLPLAVFSGDLRLALVSQDLFRMFATKPLTGGDGEEGGDAQLGKIAATLKIRNDFRPVAYFNPAIVTDASGKANVEFQLPDTTTAYRVYAVACDKGSGFTSNQRNMVVSKEFFIDPSLPRFLVPGDHLTFPINLQNKTAEKGKTSLSAEASKDLKVRLVQDAATIEPWSSAIIKADAEVTGGTEEGKLIFKGQFVGPSARYGDAIEQTFPIHSRYMPIHRVIIGDFTRTADISVDLPQILKTLKPDEINPVDFQAHLSLSTTKWAKITPGLQYLLQYPYGCVEQTSSGIIPLAGLRGLIQSGTIPGIAVTQVDRFMKKGIERLLSMQLQGGGFAYWPGQRGVSWWGTMYGTFALTMANQSGYAVPEARLKAALDFLHEGLFKTREGDSFHGTAWAKEFALLNLALNDKLTAAELEPLFKNYDSASIQSKALLLLAASKVGYLPEKKVIEMLTALNPEPDAERMDYRNSSFREIAVCLMAAMETGSDLQKADAWVGLLMKGLKPDGKWASTADTGWCLLALSKYYEKRERGKTGTVKFSIDYGADKPSEVTASEDMAVSLAVDPRKLLEKGKIRVTGNSNDLMNYTLSVTYPDLATEPSDLSRGFSLKKTIENLSGKEEIRVGDVLRVTLDIGILASEYDRGFRYEYFALEDPVPAGLVPINSELATEGAEKKRSEERYDRWTNGYYEFTPSHIEFRDDGVRVFKDHAWQGHYRYSYLARAVAAGEFWMRGSRISQMYDPDRFGKTLGKKVKVLPAEK
jgi:alpha-2-macroglobulin